MTVNRLRFGTIKQASQPTVSFIWPLDSSHSPDDLTGFTITGTMYQVDNEGATTVISGTFAVTDGPTRACTWAMTSLDTGTDGVFRVTLSATDGVDTILTLFGDLEIENNPSVDAAQNPPLVGVSPENDAWVTSGRATVPDATDLIPDAASDGTQYARKDGEWDAVATSGTPDVDTVTTNTGNSTEMVRVAAAGGLEYRTQAQVLSDIGAETAGEAATVQGNLNDHENETTAAHGNILPEDAGIVAVSSGRDLATTDAGKILECTGTFTLNCPDGLDAGFQVALCNVGAGIITISATTTLTAKGAAYTLANQYGMATLYHRGSNVWLLAGDLT